MQYYSWVYWIVCRRASIYKDWPRMYIASIDPNDASIQLYADHDHFPFALSQQQQRTNTHFIQQDIQTKWVRKNVCECVLSFLLSINSAIWKSLLQILGWFGSKNFYQVYAAVLIIFPFFPAFNVCLMRLPSSSTLSSWLFLLLSLLMLPLPPFSTIFFYSCTIVQAVMFTWALENVSEKKFQIAKIYSLLLFSMLWIDFFFSFFVVFF